MDNKPKCIEFLKIGSANLGYITVAEVQQNIEFDIKRVYWTYYTPNEVQRGGHAHKALKQVLFALAGVITFKTEDTFGNKETFILDKPNIGLLMPERIWRDIQFSHNAVLLCLASEAYTEDDYIREYAEFKKINND
jgi:hypothetical protein